MLSARSPKYPALYDELSGVRFISGRAEVSEEQALALAERRFVDGILIGEFDEDGRPVNELPAKKWAAAHTGESATESPAGSAESSNVEQKQAPPDDATDEGRRRKQSRS